jgi:uncharacterized protein
MILRARADGVALAVRAQPGAKKTAVAGTYGEGVEAQLRIAVHAPPIEGRANAALLAFLAETFSLPRSAVELLSGASSRSKVFLLRGISTTQAETVLTESGAKVSGHFRDDWRCSSASKACSRSAM